MAEIILHQYVNSPFSEKIRKIFAHKKVSWRAVEQPVIMPKPKLIPLTGGYRRIPVLQIGADIYSDTGIIIRKLDELFPEPTLYPRGLEAAAHQMNIFADRRMFWSTTPVIFEKLAASRAQGIHRGSQQDDAGRGLRPDPRAGARCAHQLRAYLDMMDSAARARQPTCWGVHSASPMRRYIIRCGFFDRSRVRSRSRRSFPT